MTGLSAVQLVNAAFIPSEGAGLRSGGRSTNRPPKIGARLSGMAGALHRASGGEGIAAKALADIWALLSGNGVWGQQTFAARLHDCQRIGVGGLRHGR